jgi:protein SCO1
MSTSARFLPRSIAATSCRRHVKRAVASVRSMSLSPQAWGYVRTVVRALSLAIVVTSVLTWMVLSPGSASMPEGGDFVLQSADGPLDSRSLRGQVVLLYFGYTFCPDICPTTLTEMGKAIASLRPDEQQRVRGVFVSVDPGRDTPERLAEYAPYFHPRIVGATSNEHELLALTARYGATFRRVPRNDGEGYAVEHPASVYVIGRDGQLVERIAHGSPLSAWQKTIHDAL